MGGKKREHIELKKNEIDKRKKRGKNASKSIPQNITFNLCVCGLLCFAPSSQKHAAAAELPDRITMETEIDSSDETILAKLNAINISVYSSA